MWMKYDQKNDNTIVRTNETGLLRCPMCKGRGYFEPSLAPGTENNEQEDRSNNTLKLPSIQPKSNCREWPKPRYKYSLPSINRYKGDEKPEDHPSHNKSCSDVSSDVQSKVKQTNYEEIRHVIKSKPESRIKTETEVSIASSNESNFEKTLLLSPRTPQNPSESLKVNISKLKANNWSEAVCALREIVQISRFHPRLVGPCMVLVYRGLIILLKSFRSTVVRTACQASNELFATMANTQRPEFDELVSLLLLKTADTNKAIRVDANEALDTMIIKIPLVHSVRTITQKGLTHKNALVRGASARLLVCVVGVVGVDAVYNGGKETRGRIISAAATFMQDSCQEVRNFGRRLMKMLIEHDDFDDVLQAEVNEVMLRRIEKVIITMKYKT